MTPDEIALLLRNKYSKIPLSELEKAAVLLAKFAQSDISLHEGQFTEGLLNISDPLEELLISYKSQHRRGDSEETRFLETLLSSEANQTSPLSIAENAQTGDIRIGNIAGRNIVHYNPTIIQIGTTTVTEHSFEAGNNSNSTVAQESSKSRAGLNLEEDLLTGGELLKPLSQDTTSFPLSNARIGVFALICAIGVLVFFIIFSENIRSAAENTTMSQGNPIVDTSEVSEKALDIKCNDQKSCELTYDIMVTVPTYADSQYILDQFTLEFTRKSQNEFGTDIIRYNSTPPVYVSGSPTKVGDSDDNIIYRAQVSAYVYIP